MRSERGQGWLAVVFFILIVICACQVLVSGISNEIQKRQDQERAAKIQQEAKKIDIVLLKYNYQKYEFDSSVTVRVSNKDSNAHSLYFFAKMLVSYSQDNGEKNSDTIWNGNGTFNIEPNTSLNVEIPFGNYSPDGRFAIPPWHPAESPTQICVNLVFVDGVDVPFQPTLKLDESRECPVSK